MKITKSQLKQIIKEELEAVIEEQLEASDLRELLSKAWDIAGMNASKYFALDDFISVAFQVQNIGGQPGEEEGDELAEQMFGPKSRVKKSDIETEKGLLQKLMGVLSDSERLFDSILRKMGRAVGLKVGKEKKFAKLAWYLKNVVNNAHHMVGMGGPAGRKGFLQRQAERGKWKERSQNFYYQVIGHYYDIKPPTKQKVEGFLQSRARRRDDMNPGAFGKVRTKEATEIVEKWLKYTGGFSEQAYDILSVPSDQPGKARQRLISEIKSILHEYDEYV